MSQDDHIIDPWCAINLHTIDIDMTFVLWVHGTLGKNSTMVKKGGLLMTHNYLFKNVIYIY